MKRSLGTCDSLFSTGPLLEQSSLLWDGDLVSKSRCIFLHQRLLRYFLIAAVKGRSCLSGLLFSEPAQCKHLA